MRSSGFDAKIGFVGDNRLERPLDARFYASVDRLSPGERVEVSKWKKNATTGRKTPLPEFRADEARIMENGSSRVVPMRQWLAGNMDALFPRKES